MNTRIYLDNNASTALDPIVLKSVIEALELTGNSSSMHAEGRASNQAILHSRQAIANYLRVHPQELIFTSGGTESLNTILRGFSQLFDTGHLITSDVEHSCTYKTAIWLQEKGWEVSFLPAGSYGAISPDQIRASIKGNTRLIALMAANNETGVKTDLKGSAEAAEAAGIPLLVDAVALLGKEQVEIHPSISFMCFSGHKIHAPKGIGCLFVRRGVKIPSLLMGGGQELERRAGTENLVGICGLGAAVLQLTKVLPEAENRMRRLRDYFENQLTSNFSDISVNGKGPRVCNTSNLSFGGIDGETLLLALDMQGISVTHGSACSSGALEPSRILLNMGIPLEKVRSSIRFSLSRFTTQEEIDIALDKILSLVKKLSRTG